MREPQCGSGGVNPRGQRPVSAEGKLREHLVYHCQSAAYDARHDGVLLLDPFPERAFGAEIVEMRDALFPDRVIGLEACREALAEFLQ